MNDFFVVEKNTKEKPQFKICAVTIGASGVGKTSFLTRVRFNAFSTPLPPTIGVDYFPCFYRIGDRYVYTQYWDTAGHERFANILTSYIRRADLVFMMYDPADEASIVHLHRQKALLEECAGEAVRILVATKADVSVPDVAEICRFAKDLGCRASFSISAKTNTNIMNCIEYALKLMITTWKPTQEHVSTGLQMHQAASQKPTAPQSTSCCKQ